MRRRVAYRHPAHGGRAMRLFLGIIVSSLLLLAVAANPARAQQPYTITQSYSITLIQHANSRVYIEGLNNRDQAVGWNDSHGLVYEAGNFYELDYPAAIATELLAINDRGDIIGLAQVGNDWVYFLYANGAFSRLELPGVFAQPADINNRGEIVGTYYDANGIAHGFLYADALTQTVDVPGSTRTSLAGINDRGEIVGTDDASAFVYSGRTFTAVTLPGTPEDINNRGQIVGTTYVQAGGIFLERAYVFDRGTQNWFVVPDSVFCDRGLIQGASLAKAINDQGDVAGYWQGYSSGGGFIARPDHPVRPSELTVGTCHRERE